MGEAVKKDDDEKVIPVGPGAEGLEAPEPEKEEDEKTDSRLAAKDDDEEDEKPDAGKRKESAKERRERAKKARDRERLELNFYSKRNEELEKRLMHLEGRTSQTEGAAIEQRITSIKAQLSNADAVIRDALKKPNGAGADDFVEAQRIRDELRDQLSTLSASKQTHERQSQQREQQRREPAAASEPRPDPRTLRHAREWADQHDWFDFQGNDEDSVIVRAIDETLAADGFDPSSADYWEELTARVKRRLPEHFKKGAASRADEDDDDMEEADETPRPKTGPKFSSGGRERPLKKGEVYVSAERKDAMKQYGVWDDPVSRNRMLKKYAAWDAEVSASSKR